MAKAWLNMPDFFWTCFRPTCALRFPLSGRIGWGRLPVIIFEGLPLWVLTAGLYGVGDHSRLWFDRWRLSKLYQNLPAPACRF